MAQGISTKVLGMPRMRPQSEATQTCTAPTEQETKLKNSSRRLARAYTESCPALSSASAIRCDSARSGAGGFAVPVSIRQNFEDIFGAFGGEAGEAQFHQRRRYQPWTHLGCFRRFRWRHFAEIALLPVALNSR